MVAQDSQIQSFRIMVHLEIDPTFLSSCPGIPGGQSGKGRHGACRMEGNSGLEIIVGQVWWHFLRG